jgi:hypothetical protein
MEIESLVLTGSVVIWGSVLLSFLWNVVPRTPISLFYQFHLLFVLGLSKDLT